MTSVVDNWTACPDLEVPPALTQRHEQWGCALMMWWLYFSFLFSFSEDYFTASRVNPMHGCLNELIHYCCHSKRWATGIAGVALAPVWVRLEKCGRAGSQTVKGVSREAVKHVFCPHHGRACISCVCVQRGIFFFHLCIFAVNRPCPPGIHSTPRCLWWVPPHPGWPAQEQKTSPMTYYSHTLANVCACTHTSPLPVLFTSNWRTIVSLLESSLDLYVLGK